MILQIVPKFIAYDEPLIVAKSVVGNVTHTARVEALIPALRSVYPNTEWSDQDRLIEFVTVNWAYPSTQRGVPLLD